MAVRASPRSGSPTQQAIAGPSHGRLRHMKLFRAMTPDSDGKPRVARSARGLGVRAEGPVRDVWPDAEGRVFPGKGGMSVAPASLWEMPAHRRPRRLGHGSTGHNEDHVFSVEDLVVEDHGLKVRIDVPDRTHALVEPSVVELLTTYESRLAGTRWHWVADES